MSHTYQLNETTLKDKDGIIYTVYGVDAVDENGKIEKTFEKIFFQRSKAIDLIDLCNEGDLSLRHIAEVIEDAVYEEYINIREYCRKM